MKKKTFNFKLFKEQFKQLRLIGFIGIGLLSLIAILIPVGRAMSLSRELSESGIDVIERSSVPIVSAHIYLYLALILLVPLLALSCFHYLTQRNFSDFYHSLPHTRTCIFTCSVGAIIAWTTILIWVPSIISVIMYSILNKYFVLEVALLLRFSLFMYIASLLIIASISIACSLTGTVFTNVVVAGIIIFLPRMFMLVFSNFVAGSSDILMPGNLFPLIDVQYNVVFSTLSCIFGSQYLTSGGLLFSSILTLLYLGLGLLLFRKRRSESSNQSAVSKKVQTIIRLVIGTTISLFPLSMICTYLQGDSQYTGSNFPLFVYTVIIIYIVACLIMLLYELLTTKKLKNVVKALPSIGYLAIINVIIVAAAFGLNKFATNYCPDADNMDYIVLQQGYGDDDCLYYAKKANSVEIEDQEILKMINKNLSESIRKAKGEPNTIKQEDSQYCIGIHTGLTTNYRGIWLNAQDYDKLIQTLNKSQAYQDAYQALPELSGSKIYLSNVSLSNEEYLELYNTAREEIKSLSIDTWISNVSQYNESCIDMLYFYATVDNETQKGFIPINNVLPKTTALYTKLLGSNRAEDKTEILTKLSDWMKNTQSANESCTIDAVLYSLNKERSLGFCAYSDDTKNISSPNSDEEKLASECVNSILNTKKDSANFNPAEDFLLKVTLSYWNNDLEEYSDYNYLFIIDHTTGDALYSSLEKSYDEVYEEDGTQIEE